MLSDSLFVTFTFSKVITWNSIKNDLLQKKSMKSFGEKKIKVLSNLNFTSEKIS